MGGGSETSGAAQMSALGSVGALSGDDTPEYVAEYGNFTIVPEIALNYNGNMEFVTQFIQQLALDFDGPADEVPHKVVFRTDAEFSHWEIMVDNTGTLTGDRLHFEVQRYSSFTHGRAFFYQTPNETGTKDVDSVDIIETPSHIFTKGVRIFDMEGSSDIYTFAGITINDSAQRTLGVINIGVEVANAAGLDPAFTPGSWTVVN